MLDESPHARKNSLGPQPSRTRATRGRRRLEIERIVNGLCDDFGMRSRIQAVVLPSEPSEFRDDVRRMFADLERAGGDQTITGECAPALDVLETDEAVEIAMDLPGVAVTAVRIAAKGHTVLIVGHKMPRRGRHDSSFHLVERGYGRFARAVRLSVACDTSRATASLQHGELRISIPRLAERRGRAIDISIALESSST